MFRELQGLEWQRRRFMKISMKKIEQLKENKLYLAKRLQELDNVFINGPKPEDGAPHILNASFVGVRSEVLLHTLEEKQIYISAGSACSSHKRAASATMLAAWSLSRTQRICNPFQSKRDDNKRGT